MEEPEQEDAPYPSPPRKKRVSKKSSPKPTGKTQGERVDPTMYELLELRKDRPYQGNLCVHVNPPVLLVLILLCCAGKPGAPRSLGSDRG